MGGGTEGEQLAEIQRLALAQRRIRPVVPGGRDRDGPGEAGRAVHPYERPCRPERRRHSDRPPRQSGRHLQPSARHRAQPLRSRLLESPLLVPGGIERPFPPIGRDGYILPGTDDALNTADQLGLD